MSKSGGERRLSRFDERILEAPARTSATDDLGLTVTWDEYMAETFPPVPSLWGEGFLVNGGGYLIVSGDTGIGKTILIVNLILSLAEGRDEFLGFSLPGRPVRSLLLEAEGSRPKFRDRLCQIAAIRGIRSSPPIFFHQRNTELRIEDSTLAQMIGESGAEFVFLDPIGRFWSGEENSTKEWRAGVTAPLGKLSTTANVAIAFTDHYAKPNENRSGQNKVRGAAAKVQDCGAAMRLEYGRGGGRSRILFFDRARDGALPFPDRDPSRMPLEMDVAAGTVRVDEREDAGELEGAREGRIADVRAALEEITRELRTSEVSTEMLRLKVQSRTGLEKSRANDLIAAAVNAGTIERARRGSYRLPGTLGAEA